MTNYNFTTVQLDVLKNIDYDLVHEAHYKYRDNHFLYKRNPENQILTVCFHGRATKGSYPIFRGYNYNLKNSDTLSIADKLQPKLNLEVTFYLNYIADYIQIINTIFKEGNYSKILFFGSSGGGFIALFLASYFNQYAFIANAFIYSNNNHYRRLKKRCEETQYAIRMDIQAVIENYGFPKKVYLFSNKADSIHVKNAKPFLQENEKYKDQIKEEFFHRKPKDGSDPHALNMPSQNTEYWIQHFVNKIKFEP